MKAMVIGANGQLGTDLVKALWRQGDEVAALTHAQIEITDTPSIRDNCARYRPEVILNCAVYHPVDECELHPDCSFSVNAVAARELALAAREIGAVLLHFSSDYVFDGEKGRPYVEADCPAPRSVFGISKLAGEQLIRSTLSQHFIIRTSGLYGLAGSRVKGGNFVETMLRLGHERGRLRVVNDLRMAQTYTRNLAEQVAVLIRTRHFGTFHASDHGDYSWYEFAQKIFRYAQMDVEITPVSWREFSAAASRPRYSVLENHRLRELELDRMQPIDRALQAYLEERGTIAAGV